jgi:hypothetical protein
MQATDPGSGAAGWAVRAVRLLRITLLVVGGVIALVAWLLLCFMAIYLASFPLSWLGGVLHGAVALVEALIVGFAAYKYRNDLSSHVGDAVAVLAFFTIANIIFVMFFSGGL